ncbi:MAG: hypothetical protein KDA44_21385 [Planctomycetales bacterium]|nr:hypothetical protein [Planctomycetales bacterium]
MPADLSQVTVLCTAFAGTGGLDRLARSLRTLHPQCKILASGPAISGAAPAGVDVVKSAPDATPGSVRNALLARVRTPWFAIVSDDMQLHRGATLAELLTPVAAERLDIAAGELVRCWKKLLVFTGREPTPGHGTFAHDRGALTLHPGVRTSGSGYDVCDYGHQFFVARTDKVRAMGGWDHQIVAGGDLEFFVRAERFAVRIGVCPQVAAWHWGHPAPPSETVSIEAVNRMSLRQLALPGGRVVTPPPARLAA